MSDVAPLASVIIRTRNSATILGRVLSAVRSQTVPAEIIVVDSGSRDETLALAHRLADVVLEMPAESFSFGGALNLGAGAARAPFHFALSSHSFPIGDRWIERSLSKYDRADVAATNGALAPPGSREPLLATYYQTLADALRHPCWGFSNTGSSWRAGVWAEHPFDEWLPACEDKEWGLRVLRAGWSIAFDPELCVTDSHRTRYGLRHLYWRTRREFQALASLGTVPRLTFDDFLREWLIELEVRGPYRRLRRRLNYVRFTELLAKYRGLSAAHALPVARAPLPPEQALSGTRLPNPSR